MFREHNYSFKVTQDLFANRCGKIYRHCHERRSFYSHRFLETGKNSMPLKATQGSTRVMRKGVRGKHGPKT